MKVIVFICVLLVLSLSLSCQVTVPRPGNEITFGKDSTLLFDIQKGRYQVFRKAELIDSCVLSDFLRCADANCITNPGNDFNKTDVRYDFLCDLRLSFWGRNTEDSIIYIVYQEGTIGGMATNCVIYRIRRKRPLSSIRISIGDIKKQNQLFSIIKERIK